MRKVKYRAWDSLAKEMLKVRGFQYYNVESQSLYRLWLSTFDDETLMEISSGFDTFVLMQYTGLKDKNGKEIYEGDIMKRPQQNADKTPNGNHYKVVEWKIFGNNSVGFNVSAQCNKYEIIGNIYQNPELLKSEIPASAGMQNNND